MSVMKLLRRAAAAPLVGAILSFAAPAMAAELDDAAAKFKQLKIERQGPILVARFDNPPRQLMDRTTVAELSELLTHVESDQQTRVLIFTGAGDRFIRHFDVGPVVAEGGVGTTSATTDPELHFLHKALLQMEALSKPTICAINGAGTAGGGLETALACDFRIMSTSGVLQLPEVRAGIIPGGGGTQRMPRIVGPARAKEIIMLAEPIDPATAERIGLVNRAVAEDQLMAEATTFANKLLALPTASVHIAKRVLRETEHTSLEDGLMIEQKGFDEAIAASAAARARASQ